MHYNSDKPVTQHGDDILYMTPMVTELYQMARTCKPPLVLGVHGDWGAGKTSFLNLLKEKFEKTKNPIIFFEAWKYQHDPTPVVALLHEIRQNLSTSRKIWNKATKLTEVTLRTGLAHLESATNYVAASAAEKIGEAWETRHKSNPLPSDVIRNLLNAAIRSLMGGDKNKRRLIVIIDDLDRCSSQTAFRLLEGIKIFLNIETCVFILGLNEREIRRAIQEHIPGKIDNQDQEISVRALEYLEKLCENIRRLPLVDADQEKIMVKKWIIDDVELAIEIKERLCEFAPCLPANPRRIKAFCNLVNHYISSYSRADNTPPVKLAGLIVPILAYIQLFHYDLHRIIQRNPEFYYELIKYLKSSEKSNYKILNDIQRSVETSVDHSGATPESTVFESLYRDPAFGPVFHIQEMVIDTPNIPVDVLKAFLRY
ncbi:KAP family NTPase [bacterium]|nr:KAP family NTPase [bacterium]